MSKANIIDFYQPGNDSLAIRASSAKVYLDGQLRDYLVAENITLAADNDFNQAILSYYPKDSNLLPEEIDSLVRCGQRVVIKMVYDGGIGKSIPNEIPVFAGLVEQIDTEISSKQQRITVVAKDFSARLKRKTVYGRGVYSDSGQAIFIAGADAIFNPAGAANRAKQAITQNGRSFKAFAADENDAEFFTCADAIYYLLCNYIPAGEIVIPTLEQLEKLTCERGIIDVDVTGLNLIDALRRCCGQAGIRFKFVPNPSLTGPAEAIVFFRPQLCRNIELNCQWPGERISVSKTNAAEITGKKNYSPVTHRYIVQGDYKIYEATFELVKAWDPALEEHNYDRYSPLTNENFNEVRDVYRKWCLNETGDYSGSPYNQGPAFDFSKIFENDSYIQRRRRFLGALTGSQDGASIGYYLEVSYVNGNYWWPYMDSFKVLLDQCGVWLSAEQFDMNMWFAILKGNIKFRITASVCADERISFASADGPVNSTAEVVDKIITLPRRFKYQKVSPYSIFENATANRIDDTQALVEFTRGLADSGGFATEQIQIKTACLSPVFTVGDGISTSPDSRDILGVKYDNRSISRIEKVQMDFANQQTILTAAKKRR
jgi:hypothetical protein